MWWIVFYYILSFLRLVSSFYYQGFLGSPPTIPLILPRLLQSRLSSSVQFSCSVMSDSLLLHGLQYARLPGLSPGNASAFRGTKMSLLLEEPKQKTHAKKKKNRLKTTLQETEREIREHSLEWKTWGSYFTVNLVLVLVMWERKLFPSQIPKMGN